MLVAVCASLGLPDVPVSAVGTLALEAVPAKVPIGTDRATVRVANAGDAPVSDLRLVADAPRGVTIAFAADAAKDLVPGSSALVPMTVTGRPRSLPAVITVKATGTSGGVPVSAVTGVELVSSEPPATIALVGNTRLTERSPADLRVVVTNGSDAPVTVALHATAEPHKATLEEPSFELAARAVRDVGLTVKAEDRLRRGAVGLVVKATVTSGDRQQDLTVTRELSVSVASDELPGPLGVASMIVLPGIVAMLLFFELRARDRRRIGVAHPGAKAVWDNKTWLLVAGGLSLLAAVVYAAVTGRDVLDAYELSDIVVLGVLLGTVGATAAAVSTWVHRRRVPVVTGAGPAEVLRAAARRGGSLSRPRYRTADDREGLLVHRDGGAYVLTPPVRFSAPDTVVQALQGNVPPKELVKLLGATFDGVFAPLANGIAAPTAVEQATEVGSGALLVYEEA